MLQGFTAVKIQKVSRKGRKDPNKERENKQQQFRPIQAVQIQVPAEQAHSWRRKGKQMREYSHYRQNKHSGVIEQVPQRY